MSDAGDVMGEQMAQLTATMRDELECLWGDLCEARAEGIRTTWSMRCENLAERMVARIKLAGITPWELVPLPALEDGTYERVARLAGVEPAVDWAAVRACRREIDERDAEYVAGRRTRR